MKKFKFMMILLIFLFFTLLGFTFSAIKPVFIQIVNPKDGAIVDGVVNIETDVTDIERVSKVEIYIDDEKVLEKSELPFIYNWDTTKVAEGTHRILAKVIDKDENIRSTNISVFVYNKKEVWQKLFGGDKDDEAKFVEQTKDGGYIVAGYTCSIGAGGSDIYIIKLDKNGKLIWEKALGGDGDDCANSIIQTSDDGYIVAGYKTFAKTGKDFYIFKIDKNGSFIWGMNFGEGDEDSAKFILKISDDDYIVAGYYIDIDYSFIYLPFGGHPKSRYGYILKINKDGKIIEEKSFGSYEKNSVIYSIQQTSDMGYIFVGIYNGEPCIVKLNNNLGIEWTKVMKDYILNCIKTVSDDGYIIVGKYSNDICII
ncbi:MAG: Ig-like domain-containing protein, partial [Candidatus Micrarchaeia archaeon]